MRKHQRIWIEIVLVFVIILVFTPVTLNQLKVGDYPHNIQQAQELSTNGYLYLKANLLFHRILLVVRDILPFNFLARISPLLKQIIDLKSYEIAALVVTLLMEVCIGLVLWWYLNHNIQFTTAKGKDWVIGGLVLLILISGPITIFTFPERQFFGYFTGNPVHNAPFTLMKLFGLIFFIMISEYAYKPDNLKNHLIAIGALLLATLAKPNIALSMLPTVFIVFGALRYKEIKNRSLLRLLALMTVLVVLVLISQYVIMYTGDRGEKILIEPFRVMLLTSPNIASVLFFLVMSIAFPLAITLFNLRSINHKVSFELAWINFFISVIYAYTLAEQSDMASANFDWNPMVAIFFLFVITIPVYISMMRGKAQTMSDKVKRIVSSGLLLLHVISGIGFLYYSTITPFLVR